MFMNKFFKSLVSKCMFLYINNIIIYLCTKQDHCQVLKSVIILFNQSQLVSKPIKFQFMAQKLVFLGHFISKDGIKLDPNKIKAVSKRPSNQYQGQVSTFLGIITYVYQFIPNCGQLTALLFAITNNKLPLIWMPYRDRCFQELNHRLCSTPILHFSHCNQSYHLKNNALDQAIGGIL